jgi:hypothetical protein
MGSKVKSVSGKYPGKTLASVSIPMGSKNLPLLGGAMCNDLSFTLETMSDKLQTVGPLKSPLNFSRTYMACSGEPGSYPAIQSTITSCSSGLINMISTTQRTSVIIWDVQMVQVYLNHVIMKGRRAIGQEHEFNLLSVPVKSELSLLLLSYGN